MSTEQRVNIGKEHPDSYQALIALSATAERAAAGAGLDPQLVDLVKLRTSQINGCAFCLRLHTREALEHGATADRLAVLAAWRESDYFSPSEQAALSLAESITLVGQTHVADADYASAASTLTAEQLSALAWVVTVMNAFNRVAITSRYHVGPD